MGGGIDAGYNTADIYNHCRQNPVWRPMKGADRRLTGPWVLNVADPKRRYGQKARGLKLYTVGNDYFQDVLQGYLERGTGAGSGYFHIPSDCDDTYLKHLANEIRKHVYVGAYNRMEERWVPRYKGAAQHLRDATKYAIAMGHILRLNKIRRPAVEPKTQDSQQEPREPRRPLARFTPKPLPKGALVSTRM